MERARRRRAERYCACGALAAPRAARSTRTLGVMKYCIILLALVTQQSLSCEFTEIKTTFRHDVEDAFEAKSFEALAEKYEASGPVTFSSESEYDEENPTTTYEFPDILAFSTWFYDRHQHISSMIIPDQVACNYSTCVYELPELTLHHGVYLVGFARKEVARCTSLVHVTVHVG